MPLSYLFCLPRVFRNRNPLCFLSTLWKILSEMTAFLQMSFRYHPSFDIFDIFLGNFQFFKRSGILRGPHRSA